MSFIPAWIFPGKGTLPSSRWPDTALARRLIGAALESGLDLLALLNESDASDRSRTRAAQPLILVDCLLKADDLQQAGAACHTVAGHSLGEYPALVVSGVLDPLDALRIVIHRGSLMDEVAGGMMAIVKLDTAAVEELCRRSEGRVVVANRNSPKQTVISGESDALSEVAAWAASAGGRAIRLAVSGPFHSPLMSAAERQLRTTIQSFRFGDPVVPVVSSVTGEVVRSGKRLKELMLSQMTSSVEWMSVLQTLRSEGVTHAVEVGPGAVLAGIGKRNEAGLAYLSYEEAKEWASSNTESPSSQAVPEESEERS